MNLRLMLATLGVDRQAFDREPKFMHLFEERSIGGIDRVLKAMRLSSEPIIVKFLESHDEVPKPYRGQVPWEAVAIEAKLNGRELLGAIILALRAYSATEVKITALTAHADITQATVESAMIPGPDGFRDRLAVHQALGFLAPPKGQTINVNFPGLDEETGNAEIAAEDIDMNEMFPDILKTQRKMLED